jgi:hypothetical protein
VPAVCAAVFARLLWPVQARADALAHLVNVAVRPGHNVTNAGSRVVGTPESDRGLFLFPANRIHTGGRAQ